MAAHEFLFIFNFFNKNNLLSKECASIAYLLPTQLQPFDYSMKYKTNFKNIRISFAL